MSGGSEYQMVGRNLRNARKAHGLRQAEMAEKLNISANAYGEYERGIKLISTRKLLEFCRILHIEPGDILNDCYYAAEDPDHKFTALSERQKLMRTIAKASETKVKLLNLFASFLDTQE